MTARERRALVIGGMVVGGAVLTLRIAPWGVRRVVNAERELHERAALLARARLELSTAGALGDSAVLLTRALQRLAPRLLSGDQPVEAQADLVARFNLIATRHHVKLNQVDQIRDSLSAGRVRRASVHASIESDIRGMSGMLGALASGDAALSVEQLRIQAPEPAAAGKGPEVLRGEVTVAGWYLGKAEP